MCEKCRANGKGLARVSFELSVELENGVKEIPLRLFSGEVKGHEGLHMAMDQGHEKFIKGLMLEIIPILTAAFAEGVDLEEAVRIERKEFLM